MQIPHIEISLAPPEPIPVEPYSPFANSTFQLPQQDDDGFRPLHLTPPPVHTRFIRNRTRDDQAKQAGKGLDRARFEALLNASKERQAGAKKATDLRKEVALKVHKNKQAERRALFLSKVLAPPSPTATTTPVTPPESPAVFHYSLPSPGLVSPLAHYESLHDEVNSDGVPCKPWVEQVDFKLLSAPPKPKHISTRKFKQGLPSLEQISARLNCYRSARAFNDNNEVPAIQSAPVSNHLVVGRLKMPVRSAAAKAPSITVTDTTTPLAVEPVKIQPPSSPLLTASSDLKITTLVVPRTQSVSPTELTRVNLLALNSRESRSSAMLTTLRRRTQSTATFGLPPRSPTEIKAARRHSAPPETSPLRERSGFEHPILALPGAF
ncbi:hypothetical protein CC2G_000941 [Coprinopsis cinerea AmutBmut pab1-1]|nr:hypothetical protein CC2G_000941 [Coprinopsis cinerea AmutBmut pab1-1]